jgi:predicted nucleic acid-binding protein
VHLIDTSAWVEYLRATGSNADAAVTRLIEENTPIAITEPVIMELLAGARDSGNFRRLGVMTGGLPLMAVEPACLDRSRSWQSGRADEHRAGGAQIATI